MVDNYTEKEWSNEIGKVSELTPETNPESALTTSALLMFSTISAVRIWTNYMQNSNKLGGLFGS
jgi:hypothetical protein